MTDFNVKRAEYAQAIFKKLDAKDGQSDNKISASIWNEFVKESGGKEIKSFINKDNAIRSIMTYLRKLTGGDSAKLEEVTTNLSDMDKINGWTDDNGNFRVDKLPQVPQQEEPPMEQIETLKTKALNTLRDAYGVLTTEKDDITNPEAKNKSFEEILKTQFKEYAGQCVEIPEGSGYEFVFNENGYIQVMDGKNGEYYSFYRGNIIILDGDYTYCKDRDGKETYLKTESDGERKITATRNIDGSLIRYDCNCKDYKISINKNGDIAVCNTTDYSRQYFNAEGKPISSEEFHKE